MGNNVTNAASQFIGPNNEAANSMTTNIMDYCGFVTCLAMTLEGIGMIKHVTMRHCLGAIM